MSVSKRHQGENRFRRRREIQERGSQKLAEFVYGEVGRIDDQVRLSFEVGQQGPLGPDAVQGGSAGSQRVWPSTLAETADENRVAGIQEDHTDPMAVSAEPDQDIVQGVQEAPFPRVDHQRDAVDALLGLGAQLCDLRNQGGRQVVDAAEPQVLKGPARRALACPGHASNNDEVDPAHGSTGSLPTTWWRAAQG